MSSQDAPHNAVSAAVGGVVVGYDGSPASEVALDWGADTAVALDLALTILTARPDAEAEVYDLDFAERAGLVEPELARMLGAAQTRTHDRYPSLDVTTVIHPESPVDGLLAASGSAQMIAIGSRGLGGFSGLLLGSTALEVTPHAKCPVVVLYVPDAATAQAKAEAAHPDEVVVGFDGSHSSALALSFGLRYAQAVGLGVAIVSISPGHDQQAVQPVDASSTTLPEGIQDSVRTATEIARGFPNVPVSFLHGVGRPAGALIREASGSRLAVVGARGRGGFAQLLLGSVGLQLLLHAECPVAVVHDLPQGDALTSGSHVARQ